MEQHPFKQDATLALLASLEDDQATARHHLLNLDLGQLLAVARAAAQLADHCLRIAVAHRGLGGPDAPHA